jgi:hypothetical protein
MRATKSLGPVAILVVAIIVGFAAPAGASKPTVVTAGLLNTVLGTFDLTPGSQGSEPCPEKTSTLKFTTTAGGGWSAGGSFARQFQFPSGSGIWFQIDFTFLLGSGGTWSGTGPTYPLTGVLAISKRVTFIGSASNPDCTKTNVMCQAINGVFAVTGTYTGTLPATRSGDQITFNGSTIIPLQTGSPCGPPWVAAGGTNATLSPLSMTIS